MPMGRTIRRTALGLGLAAGAVSAGAYYLLQRPVPKAKGRVKLRAVRAEVEILRDRWGVPHIYAGNLHDLFSAMGYAQAQDRLWQMEFNRRLASGALAEGLGGGALEIDRVIRRVGL